MSRETRLFFDCPTCGSSGEGTYCTTCAVFLDCRYTRRVKVSGKSLHVCDSRCTHAVGMSCDCACNGANHGREAA